MSKEKKTKDESPLTFDELAWEFERVHEIRDRVDKNVTEAVKREEAYARNRRMLGMRNFLQQR